MPIWSLIKDYVIDSEDDVPEEYREEVERRLSSKEQAEKTEPAPIHPGVRERFILREDEISQEFSDADELYFGHGTPGSNDTIDSIFETGLRVTVPDAVKGYTDNLTGLDSTTIVFGEGKESLFEEQKEVLDNWPHKDSKNIIIISVPQRYALRPCDARLGSADFYEAFYTGSEEEGFKLRPEFIKGIYNAVSHAFIPNEAYYKNLPIEEQERLFEDVRRKYIDLYASKSPIAPKEASYPLSLDEAEMRELSIEWYRTQVERLRKDREATRKNTNVGTGSMPGGGQSSESDLSNSSDDGWDIGEW